MTKRPSGRSTRISGASAADLAKTKRDTAQLSPAGFAHIASGGRWQPADHLLAIDQRLVAIERGEIDRLMVFMPPRSGKSMFISQYTPVWYLGRHPDRRVVVASYGAQLASDWGRKARDVVEEHGARLFGISMRKDSKAADHWNLAEHTGGMNTAGVGGALTGFGAHLLIIDDPLKDAEEASSEIIRARHIDWWRSVARTRLMPGGAVVLMQTRWHEEDLAGWLLEDEKHGGDSWEVLSLPAIAEEDDALDREPGAPLWPDMFPIEAIERTRRALGAYFFGALYQQRPAPADGIVYHRSDFRYFKEDGQLYWMDIESKDGTPRSVGIDHCYRFVTCDPAFSSKETADYTVLCLWAVTPWLDLLLLDVERVRFEMPDLPGLIRRYYELHKPTDVRIESTAYGAHVVDQLLREGLPILELQADTDKVTRARGAVPRYEAHAVFHRQGADWLDVYERELIAFPHASHDDQADCFAYAALALPDLQIMAYRQKEIGKTEMGGLATAPL